MKKIRFFSIWLSSAMFLVLAGFDITGAAVYTGRSSFTPWSGYWWPIVSGELITGYRGSPSPLEKYDLYTTGVYPGLATQAEARSHPADDPEAKSWWGYCYSWANAAIMEDVTFAPSVNNGVAFAVGDKKGLLTLCHKDDPIRWASTDNDPLAFHQYLIEYIGEQKIPFAADLDHGIEVWSFAIYRYEMDVTEHAAYDDVACAITYASDFVPPDFNGTQPNYRNYYYRLYKATDGSYTHGIWINGSENNHPENVWMPIGQKAENPYLDYDIIRNIVLSVDDETEDRENLLPGHYLLTLSPDDTDVLDWSLPMGCQLKIVMALDPQSPTDVPISYTIAADGAPVAQGAVEHALRTETLEVLLAGEYRLTFGSSADNPAPAYVHFYVDIQYYTNAYFLSVPGRDAWKGLGMHNPAVSGNNVYVTHLLSQSGMPIYSTGAATRLPASAHWAGVLDRDYPWDYFSSTRPVLTRVSSQSPVQTVLLDGDAETLSGVPAVAGPGAGPAQLVAPWFTLFFDSSAHAFLKLFNTGSGNAGLDIDYYSADGFEMDRADIVIASREVAEYSAGNYPGRVDHDGWALITDASGMTGGVNALTIGMDCADALPLLSTAQTFYIPHLAAANGGWETQLVLMNPQSEVVAATLACIADADVIATQPIVLQPYEKYSVTLNEDFLGLSAERIRQSWLRINAALPVAGFFTYRFNSDSMASMPLITPSQFAEVRYAGHVASDAAHWWNGLMLLNKETQQNAVDIIAYSAAGARIASVRKMIPAMGKMVATVGGLFPGAKGKVASLKVTAAGQVAGTLLYGSRDANKQLSGIVLE